MKRGFAILLFFVGVGLILVGLYSELQLVSFDWLLSGWLPGGRLATVFLYAGVLVIMWTAIYFMAKSLVRTFPGVNNSGTGQVVGGLIYTVAILATLVIIGAMIFEIAQYAKQNQMDKSSGRSYNGFKVC